MAVLYKHNIRYYQITKDNDTELVLIKIPFLLLFFPILKLRTFVAHICFYYLQPGHSSLSVLVMVKEDEFRSLAVLQVSPAGALLQRFSIIFFSVVCGGTALQLESLTF